MGLSFEQVVEGTGLPLETVEQLEKEILVVGSIGRPCPRLNG